MDEKFKQLLLECTGFEWDEGNKDKNWIKHKVTSSECEQIFFNQSLIINFDEKHSNTEIRFYALGHTDLSRKLFIVFTVRNKKIRIISARDMSKKERKIYEAMQ
ncbi:MAG TPA: BrnT family toxin [Deltaproteobacteria bacterium]|nr:MAG: BrnT family toxin [Deltaproteobacteria bacterium]HEC31116.1 BrnT family toxin [Deltaproteobacteria bacterium]